MSYFLESRLRGDLFHRVAGKNQTTGGSIHHAQPSGSCYYSIETFVFFVDHMRPPTCIVFKKNIFHFPFGICHLSSEEIRSNGRSSMTNGKLQMENEKYFPEAIYCLPLQYCQ